MVNVLAFEERDVWGGKIQNYWNEIAQTATLAHNLNIEQSARLFALVNFGMADATK